MRITLTLTIFSENELRKSTKLTFQALPLRLCYHTIRVASLKPTENLNENFSYNYYDIFCRHCCHYHYHIIYHHHSH